MNNMLYLACQECRNFFLRTVEKGTFSIRNEILTAKQPYLVGSYIRLVGSILNDGVYRVVNNRVTLAGARDEVWDGAVCGLAIPPDFVRLSEVIQEFEAKKGTPSALSHESFGGYSYTMASGDNGAPLTWQAVFAPSLNNYRKMFEEAIV